MVDESSTENKSAQKIEAEKKIETEVSKLFARHNRVAEGFGQLMLLLMNTQRYGHLTVAELGELILEPLAKGNILLVRPTAQFAGVQGVTVSAAIWAKVSEEVDKKIREQIEAKSFPVRLAAEEWNSGDIQWALDVVALQNEVAKQTLGNLKSHFGGGPLAVHPNIRSIV